MSLKECLTGYGVTVKFKFFREYSCARHFSLPHRSCEVDLDGLIDVIYRVLCLDTIKHEREHWIANYLTLPY